MTYDVIVLGLGGIGSAIAARLSGEGFKVLGLEQFGPVHDKGSSHGETRAIRKAYFEDPRYVPLMLRAYELWDQLSLIERAGCLIMGPESSVVLRGCLKSARQFSLDHSILETSQLRDRFRVPEGTRGFFEPDGGYLPVEKCVETFLKQAELNGAVLRFNAPVQPWTETHDGVRVGEFHARKVVVALGSWTKKFVPELPLQPKRAIQYWFDASGGENLPVYFFDSGRWIYGFPKLGSTIKLAFHNALEDCDPDDMNRAVSADEVAAISEPAHVLLPQLGQFSRAKTCIYNMTPDENFILGQRGNLIFATGFSGHGFKFAPVIGEIVADFMKRQNRFDLGLFSPDRF